MRGYAPALLAAACLTLLALLAGPASAWYPQSVLAEDGTATWCGYCPNAYDGLEINKDWFDVQEFNALRYYANSGGYSCATSTARLGYYGITSFPTVMFGGDIRTVGAGAETATGLPYRGIIEARLAAATYFKLAINSMTHGQNSMTVDLDLTVMENLPSIATLKLRVIAAQDSIVYSASETYQDLTIGSHADVAVTVDQVGQTQNAVLTFPVAPWGAQPHFLEAIAFVQDDSNKRILASASSHPVPAYALRYYALGERAVVGEVMVGDLYHYDTFRVYNAGTTADTYHISVALQSPVGWAASLCDPGGLCYGGAVDLMLIPGQYKDLELALEPSSSGYGMAIVTMSQDNAPGRARELRYVYMTDDLQVLLVDDDGGATYENYFTDAVAEAGYSFGVWDRALGAPTRAILEQFDAVVWWTGLAYPTLDADDRTELGLFLDGGGSLFVTGQEIGWELNDEGGAAYTWYQNYLHANYIADDTNDYTLNGVPGDPISDGLNLVTQGGDGANNQTYPDDIDPRSGASIVWTYDATRNAAIKADTGTHRVVYMASGFEAVNSPASRRLAMQRILDWLYVDPAAVDDDLPPSAAVLTLAANPVQSPPTLRFTLSRSGAASLKIYSLDGRLIRTLADGVLAAGSHSRTWDRADEGGRIAPAGVYYYRFEAAGTDQTGRFVLIH